METDPTGPAPEGVAEPQRETAEAPGEQPPADPQPPQDEPQPGDQGGPATPGESAPDPEPQDDPTSQPAEGEPTEPVE